MECLVLPGGPGQSLPARRVAATQPLFLAVAVPGPGPPALGRIYVRRARFMSN